MNGPLHRFFAADHRRLEGFPEPPLKPYNDAPEVFRHIDENVERSRRQWAEGDLHRE